MATRDLFSLDAELGSEEEDEDFDEDNGEPRRRKPGGDDAGGNIDDSSEEEEDDDDEEAARLVREGFIVDEDEDEQDKKQRKRREKRKRREEREEEEVLDEEDLDLIGELAPQAPAEQKFKRLKRGHRDDDDRREARGVEDIFAEDNEDLADDVDERRFRADGAAPGEFEGFIEEDYASDEDQDRMQEEREVRRGPRRDMAAMTALESSGLDEQGMEDMRAAFGDGTEYDWALELQEGMDDEQFDPDKPLELKDVFEPSQLVDKMMTDADNLIRSTDVPERFQLARQPFTVQDLSEEEAAAQAQEEAVWVSDMLWPRKRFDPRLREPFQKSVGHVLEFVNVEDFEVPFIFQHRKDYLIHAGKAQTESNGDTTENEITAVKLLVQSDLWDICDLDLRFRAMVEKRMALKRSYEAIKIHASVTDSVVDDMLPNVATMEEVQDIQDYVHFQYSAELRDVHAMNTETNGAPKRARAAASVYEKMRSGRAYSVVRAFGITPDSFAQSTLGAGGRSYTEDPTERPDDMADQYIDTHEFSTGQQVLRAAKAMFAEELAMSPRMRKVVRGAFYANGVFDCIRTEKGRRKIDEDHPYYELKYLRSQTLPAVARKPELFLRMLKAEEEGFVNVALNLQNASSFRRNLYKNLESDNYSEVADAWNSARREVLDMALIKLEKIMVKSVKENLKTECENSLAKICREEYSKRLDQAPYKPRGESLGTEPRVLALSNGNGTANRDAIIWAWVEDGGRVLENGKFTDLRLANLEKSLPDAPDVAALRELVERRKPDVIAVSGFTPEARVLYKDLQAIIDMYDLRGSDYEDDDGNERRDKIDVIQVNDEVARLYHTSDRSTIDYPGLAPLTKYCIGLARYLQSPLKEYAALGRDIISISFNPDQNLLPQEKLMRHLETAMIDMVNLVGVDINAALTDSSYTGNLLRYICGLGPRKAIAFIQAVHRNGGYVMTREELVGDPEKNKLQAVGPKVWANCASFLYIDYDSTEPLSDYLDNTRVHPEDYELGRKMAADALELDEEDIKAEVDENGSGAVVRKLIRDDAQEKVNDLILEMYADQLESNFSQRKRATLETIRAELQTPYEELRLQFAPLSSDEIFTMLTGETKESLIEGMVVPVSIKRVFPDHMEVRLDCGIEGGISESEYPAGVGGEDGVEARRAFQPHQTVQAKILYLNRKQLSAQLSLREDSIRMPYRRDVDRDPGEWDEQQEEADKREAAKNRDDVSGRAQRVIKHPLFKPFNATQAEEYLGPQPQGSVVVRPSSKGLDHLAVTWKVSDNVFQHIDVLELDKENEFSVGRQLRIGGRYSYSDLDELIVNHVNAMSSKVDEIMTDERYQTGSKMQTEQWLSAYMEANPKRSMYAFCINREFPGYFFLCFKAGQSAKQMNWPVKIVPQAFELQKHAYPDMKALKNGFKTLFTNQQQNGRRRY